MQSVKKKDYASAEVKLKKLVRTSPRNSLFWFNLGNAHFLQGEYQSAKRAYRRTISLKGNLAPVARFYFAKAQMKLGYVERAATQLKLIDQEKLPDNLSASVDEFRKQVQDDLLVRAHKAYKIKKYRLADRFIRKAVALGEDSDVIALQGMIHLKRGRKVSAYSALSKSRELRDNGNRGLFRLMRSFSDRIKSEIMSLSLQGEVAAGWNTNIDADGPGDSPEENRSILLQLTADKYLYRKENFSSDLRGYFGLEEFLLKRDNPFDQHSSAESITASIESINHWRRGKRSYYLMPRITESMESGTWYWEKFGVGFSYEERIKSRSFIVDYRVSKLSPKNDAASSLAAGEQTLTFSWAKFWKNSSASAGWELQRYSGQDEVIGTGLLPKSYDSQGPVVAVFWTSPSKLWRIDSTFYVSLRDYKTAEQPSGSDRRDTFISFFARISYWLESAWGKPNTYFQLERINNKSNLGATSIVDRTYDQNIYYFGIVWDWNS